WTTINSAPHSARFAEASGSEGKPCAATDFLRVMSRTGATPHPVLNAGITLASFVEGNETLLTFVPQRQSNTTEAFSQCKPTNAAEVGVISQHQRQSVIGDA